MDQDNKNKPEGAQTNPGTPVTTPPTNTPVTQQTSPLANETQSVTTPPVATTLDTNTTQPAATEKLNPVIPVGTTPVAPEPAQPTTPTDMSQTPPPVTPPQNPGSPQDPGYAQTKSHNMMFIIVGIVVLVIISLAVLFFFRQFTSMTDQGADTTPSPQAMTSPTNPPVSPTVTPANAEEEELQQIDLGEIEEELSNIEKDITEL